LPHTVRVDGRSLRVTFTGVVNAAAIQAYAKSISAGDAFHRVVRDRLIDMRAATDFDLRYEEVAAFARARREREYANDFKVALLAGTADEGAALAWLSDTRPSVAPGPR